MTILIALGVLLLLVLGVALSMPAPDDIWRFME